MRLTYGLLPAAALCGCRLRLPVQIADNVLQVGVRARGGCMVEGAEGAAPGVQRRAPLPTAAAVFLFLPGCRWRLGATLIPSSIAPLGTSPRPSRHVCWAAVMRSGCHMCSSRLFT